MGDKQKGSAENSLKSEEIEEDGQKVDIQSKRTSGSGSTAISSGGDDVFGLKRTKTYTDFDARGDLVVKEGTPDDQAEKIVISGETFIMGRSTKSDTELLKLSQIAKVEAGPAQMKKVVLCVFMIACVIIMNFLMPTSTYTSPIGLSKCSIGYWCMIGGFLVVCLLVTTFAVRLNKAEQRLKIKYSVNYKQGDLVYRGKNLANLVVIGFFGGLIAGALGLGGGSIYNPAFLSMGVHPKSSGATGMFLVMISTINSVIINYVNGYLQFYYACWISFYALVGSIAGMMATDWVVKKTGKPSILVWLLVIVFLISAISTPIFGAIQISESAAKGRDVWGFRNFCE